MRITHGENFDVSYVSNKVKLRFNPRASPRQDAGHMQYDLLPTAVMWTAAGTDGDCTISGQIIVDIPRFENQSIDLLPTRPAYGYLNVVGLDGGDFHSVMVQADGFPAAFLLHIVFQPNTYEGPSVVFKEAKIIDMAKPAGFLDLLPPGVALPEAVQQALGHLQLPDGSRSTPGSGSFGR